MMRGLTFALVTAVAVALAGCGGSPEEDVSGEAATETTEVAGPTIETNGLPVLLEVGSDSCTACKSMAVVLEELTKEYSGLLEVRFEDARKDKEVAARYSVQIIPTQIFFDEEGRELFRHQGFYAKESILSKWAEFGYAFDAEAEGA